MKKNTIFLFSLLFLILGCKNDDDFNNTCNVLNPIEDLSWLKERAQELEPQSGEFYISQAEYKGNTIFIFGNCCAACNTIVPVYNCEGTKLGNIGDSNFSTDILNNDVIIWKPTNFVCL